MLILSVLIFLHGKSRWLHGWDHFNDALACFVDWNSALMIIINGENDDHLEMLEGGVMRQLLDEKWKAFARVSKASAKVSSVFYSDWLFISFVWINFLVLWLVDWLCVLSTLMANFKHQFKSYYGISFFYCLSVVRSCKVSRTYLYILYISLLNCIAFYCRGGFLCGYF